MARRKIGNKKVLESSQGNRINNISLDDYK